MSEVSMEMIFDASWPNALESNSIGPFNEKCIDLPPGKFLNFKTTGNQGDNFDVVLLNDILDHVIDPVQTLQSAIKLLNRNGKICIMFHPWAGRVGTHLYQLNKAYAHFFINQGIWTNELLNPLQTYKDWIKQNHLSIEHMESTLIPVDDFFYNKTLENIILKRFKTKTFPDYQMQQQLHYFICSQL